MDNNQSSLICYAGGWGLAVLAGALAFVLLMLVGDWTFIQAVFAAVVITIIVGALVSWIACKPLPGPNETVLTPPKDTHPVKSSAEAAAAATAAAKAGAKAPDPADADPSSSPAAAVAAAKAGVKASAPLAGEAELATRKGTWRYESDEKPAAAPAEAAAEEGTKPATLDAPRGGGADNLKEIKGVGPKLEQLLHSMGFYHFDQIAKWTAEEIAWVDSNLEGFKGRATRDEWVAQAKILAAGGDTEFSKRVDDGDVY
jgi:predicted flap endonuclease-1-like 5' DNA nuclease